MKLFLLLLPFFLSGAIDTVLGGPWEIIVSRTDTVIGEPDKIDTDVPIMDGQSITFNYDVQPGDYNLYGQVSVSNPGGPGKVARYVGKDRAVDLCTELGDKSWEDIVGMILRTLWLPNGTCPVTAGTYTLSEPVGPMMLTIEEFLVCGDYSFEIDIGSAIKSKYVIQTLVPNITCDNSLD